MITVVAAIGVMLVAVAGPTAPMTQVALATMVQRAATTVRAMLVLNMVDPL